MTLSLKSPSKFREEIKAKLDKRANEALDDYDYDMSLEEGRKVKIKVNAKGKRRRKVVCGKGKRFDGTKCVAQKAGEKLAKRKKTLKSKGAGAQKRASRLRLKALKKRKGMGLK